MVPSSAPPVDPFFRRALAAALAAHVLAAFFSLGYHHLDEHFQILELLSYRLGRTPAAALAPEFALRMRPFLQIAPMYLVARAFEAVVGFSPIWLERLLRLIASIAGLLVCAAIARRLDEEVRDRFARRAGVLGLLLLWPLCYTHARLSAEAIGATLFWAGWLVMLRGDGAVRGLLAGLAFGAAATVRYQIAFAFPGLALSPAFRRRSWPFLAGCAAGIAGSLAAGAVADRWGYGAWTFAPWNYFAENILHGYAARFGVEPPWWYAGQAALVLGAVFGVPVLLAIVWFWVARFDHPAALPSLTFVAAHCLVGHKELRFLIPVLPLVPIAVAHALAAVASSHRAPRLAAGRPPGTGGWLALARGTTLAWLGLNLLVLPAMILRPANLPQYYFTYVDSDFRDRYDVVWDGREPMRLVDLQVYYYRPLRYHAEPAGSTADLERRLDAGAPFLYFRDALALPPSPRLEAACRVRVQTVPRWMRFAPVLSALDPEVIWSLYECRRP